MPALTGTPKVALSGPHAADFSVAVQPVSPVAALTGKREVEIWGDGEQTRSFTYIDDCVQGTKMFTRGDVLEPLNLGSSELTTINNLYYLVADIAGIEIDLKHIDGPLGVRGRNSDNTMIREVYGWEPSISLADGMAKTYAWFYDQVKRTQG